MSIEDERVHQVIARLLLSLGGSDGASERAAEEQVAAALQVPVADFRAWRADPRLTPLHYRLALSFWIEAAGRGARMESLCEMGRQLREATQLERAAHMVQGAARYADWPKANRTDVVMAYTEVQCRRSPPPPVPIVDDYPLGVMFEQLLVRDEQHFAPPSKANDDRWNER